MLATLEEVLPGCDLAHLIILLAVILLDVFQLLQGGLLEELLQVG